MYMLSTIKLDYVLLLLYYIYGQGKCLLNLNNN